MEMLDMLRELREFGGTPRTTGLDEAALKPFMQDPDLQAAVATALERHRALRADFADFLRLDEVEQIHQAQAGLVNFYPDDAVNPYLPAAARGPWIITLKGAVLHDSGGYGMLGFGHNHPDILAAVGRAEVMANVMTPSVAQLRFTRALDTAIGHTRGGNPFARFLCLNSGSEAVSLAGRFVDINARRMTDPGGRHAGKKIKHVSIKGSFHGRTEGPAMYSSSTRATYQKYLASFRGDDTSLTVDAYDIDQLRGLFAEAEKHGWFIEAVYLEPVMGEGDPGRALTTAFYQAARELTRAHGSLLLVDSIQAGLRAHGVLSIVDYPGFEKLDPPDMETYSKAVNAGQYPLSVLAVTAEVAALYQKGVYGNTMTGNPRALDVACATLGLLTDDIRANIRARGEEFVTKLEALREELGGLITKVQGTGLLFSCELAPQFKCFGADSTEEYMRLNGIGVIHGGANSLRFTPHFAITGAEVDLIVAQVRQALLKGPRHKAKEAA